MATSRANGERTLVLLRHGPRLRSRKCRSRAEWAADKSPAILTMPAAHCKHPSGRRALPVYNRGFVVKEEPSHGNPTPHCGLDQAACRRQKGPPGQEIRKQSHADAVAPQAQVRRLLRPESPRRLNSRGGRHAIGPGRRFLGVLMSLVYACTSWVRHTFAWSGSGQSWIERCGALGLMAAGLAIWWSSSYLPNVAVATLWGLLILAAAILSRRGWLKLFGPVLFYDMVRSARRGRYFLLRML